MSDEKLMKSLECPICFHTSTPPIFQCRNGHIMCKDCHAQVESCGVCRVDIESGDGIRNLALEKLTEDLVLACKFAENGCDQKIKIDELDKHALECKFR